MKKKFFLLFFSLLLSKLFYAQEGKIEPSEIASRHYNSIVKILMFDSISEAKKPGSGYMGRGSGFFVTDDGIVFTNRHVVKLALGLNNYTYYDRNTKSYITRSDEFDKGDLSLNFYTINY